MGLEFPHYSGNIKISDCKGYTTLDEFIKINSSPPGDYMAIFDKIEKAEKLGDKDAKAKLKEALPSFTPCVKIPVGKSRKYDNITEFTGLMQIDLDKIPTVEQAKDLKEHIFNYYDNIVCCYLSPSKRGIKALMKIKRPKIAGQLYTVKHAIKEYKKLHKAVETEFEQYEYFDHATNNAILPLFLSYDKDILVRDYETTKAWLIEDWYEETKVRLNDIPSHSHTSNDYNYKRTVKIATDRINSIIDGNGHPQVRTAGLILGSRVGAGYISQYEAESLMETLIRSNAYLSKGLSGYIKTSKWAINQGINNPKYY